MEKENNIQYNHNLLCGYENKNNSTKVFRSDLHATDNNMEAEIKAKTRLNPMELKRRKRKLAQGNRLSMPDRKSDLKVDKPGGSLTKESSTYLLKKAKVHEQTSTQNAFSTDNNQLLYSSDENNQSPSELFNQAISSRPKKTKESSCSDSYNHQENYAWMKSDTGFTSKMDNLYNSVSHWSTASLPSKPKVNIPLEVSCENDGLLDYSLKTKVIILTSFSCPLALSANSECSIINNFVSDKYCISNSPRSIKNNLHYWMYPSSTLPPSFLMKKLEAVSTTEASSFTLPNKLEKSSISFFHQRQREWEDAFRSVYFMVRNGSCKYFYVLGHQSVFFFGHISVKDSLSSFLQYEHLSNPIPDMDGENDDVFAFVSRSTNNLRQYLIDSKIPFTTPYNLQDIDKEITLDIENDTPIFDQELSTHGRISLPSDKKVHGPDSFLLLQGHIGVHGLFIHLLNQNVSVNQDNMKIISSKCFINATLKCCDIIANGKITNSITSHSLSSEVFHRYEIQGYFLPEMTSLLKRNLIEFAQDEISEKTSQIRMIFETCIHTTRFNVNVIKNEKNEITTECSKRYIEQIDWDSISGCKLGLKSS